MTTTAMGRSTKASGAVRPTKPDPDGCLALPPRRIVRTLQALDRAGAHATVQTLCRDDLGTAMDVTLDLLADATSPCFARTIDAARCALV